LTVGLHAPAADRARGVTCACVLRARVGEQGVEAAGELAPNGGVLLGQLP
jgi:hypothetical protein